MVISIVSPVYKAEKIIPTLVSRIEKSVSPITNDYEIILVEDGGPDNSWNVIDQIAKSNTKVKGIKLSRNFGQHYAITAGLDHAKGEWVIVMDCDLQDQPEEIPKLYNKALEGFHVVLARREERQDNMFKIFGSWVFHKTLSYLTGKDHDSAVANFGIYHKKVIKNVCSMRESIRYFPTMVHWVGFKQTKIDVKHASREDGKTSYNLKRLINLALDIILAYSDKPIRLTIKAGLIISVFSLLAAFTMIIRYFGGLIEVSGYASLIVSIWFFSGLIIMTLGTLGLYIGKTFEGVKNRPIYIIEKNANNE